jgi:hypothetical protein
LPAPPTIWCACEIWRQFRRCKFAPKCVWSSIELDPEAIKTPELKPFNIKKGEKQKEEHCVAQFFSSLLDE